MSGYGWVVKGIRGWKGWYCEHHVYMARDREVDWHTFVCKSPNGDIIYIRENGLETAKIKILQKIQHLNALQNNPLKITKRKKNLRVNCPPDKTGQDSYLRFPIKEDLRDSDCWRCHKLLNNSDFPECINCGWIICSCGACREGYLENQSQQTIRQ